MDRLRKNIIDLFKQNGFKITISINLTSTDFLDIKFDLLSNKFSPYKKPNDVPVYVHRGSNHPVNILKQLPKMTGERLSNLSSSKDEFDKAASEYKEVLARSGFKENLSYAPKTQRNRRQRQRKILWYNPPFDLQVKTDIGRTFLRLIDTNFPPQHRLHKIINRNTVKISYSCMPNMAAHIASHNKNIIEKFRKDPAPVQRTCNCQQPNNCPLDGNCLQEAVVYRADITPETDGKQFYIGLTERPFKGRWSDHCTSFQYPKYRNKSKLSGFVWKMKDKRQRYNIKWSIIKRSNPYKAGSKRCNLCLWEKYHILKGNRDNMINKKDELISKCRHVDKFMLKNFKDRGGQN